jgi:hypothetical protein
VAIIVCETPNSTSANHYRSKKMQVCLLFPLKHFTPGVRQFHAWKSSQQTLTMLCNAKPQVDQPSDPAQRLEQMCLGQTTTTHCFAARNSKPTTRDSTESILLSAPQTISLIIP